jgi:hypothetical protein
MNHVTLELVLLTCNNIYSVLQIRVSGRLLAITSYFYEEYIHQVQEIITIAVDVQATTLKHDSPNDNKYELEVHQRLLTMVQTRCTCLKSLTSSSSEKVGVLVLVAS